MYQQAEKSYYDTQWSKHAFVFLYTISFYPSDIYLTSVSLIASCAEHKERLTNIQTFVSIYCTLGEVFVLFSQNATVFSVIAVMNLFVPL